MPTRVCAAFAEGPCPEGPYLEGEVKRLSGCKVSAAEGLLAGASGQCQSEAAPAGEIVTNTLTGALGETKGYPHRRYGWALAPSVQEVWVNFDCGSTELTLSGAIIAEADPVDATNATTLDLNFKAHSAPTEFFGSGRGRPEYDLFLETTGETKSFERAYIKASATLLGEEPLELRGFE